MIAKKATELSCEPTPRGVRLDDGATIRARTVIIATGARYRKPSLANLEQFESAGVYYTATFMEAQLCDGDEVIVVGGANSAGQAAVFLAQTARRVHLLVRSHSLSESMSRYLIRRIEETPAIQLRTRTEIVALEGNGHLERVQWRDGTDAVSGHDIRHVFLMTGADANTAWLKQPCHARRERLHQDRAGPDAARIWPLPDGRSSAHRIRSKPHCRACSPWATFGAATSSAWHRQSVKARSPISFVHRVLAEGSAQS